MLQHGGRALHDVRQTREDEPPPGDHRDGLRQAGAQAEVKVLHQDLLEGLKTGIWRYVWNVTRTL